MMIQIILHYIRWLWLHVWGYSYMWGYTWSDVISYRFREGLFRAILFLSLTRPTKTHLRRFSVHWRKKTHLSRLPTGVYKKGHLIPGAVIFSIRRSRIFNSKFFHWKTLVPRTINAEVLAKTVSNVGLFTICL